MTKPIDWESEEQRPAVQVYHRLEVLQQSNLGEDRRWATPSDLVAALAAMPVEDREAVLGQFLTDSLSYRSGAASAEARLKEATARAEDAERERERLRLDAAQRDRDWTVIRTLTDAPYGPATTVEAVRRVVSERDSLLESVAAREKERDEATARIEALEKELFSARLTLGSLQHEEDVTRRQLKAEPCESIPGALRRVVQGLERERDKALAEQERLLQSNARYSRAADEAMRDRDAALGERNRAQAERDEARKERDRSNHLRAGMLPDTRRELGALGCEDVADAARRVVAERDSLRTRAIAAETAAAQREPREYPLAEGSPLPTIDPERLDLVRRALSGYVDTDQSPEQAARVAVAVADAALSVMRGLL